MEKLLIKTVLFYSKRVLINHFLYVFLQRNNNTLPLT